MSRLSRGDLCVVHVDGRKGALTGRMWESQPECVHVYTWDGRNAWWCPALNYDAPFIWLGPSPSVILNRLNGYMSASQIPYKFIHEVLWNERKLYIALPENSYKIQSRA